ncbi:zincin-like metallopeptidase domain-containing protein [Janthinobacterium sp. HLX7-2]|uniref:zincin-like metallopeptidase domain-containing protein n=1 Tax=Janthinobacterium sp. HLX7-2 TaxID=1259331 RepID=UPI003F2168BA
MSDIPKSLIETIADKLIAQLKEGTAPWQKPWQPGEPGAFLPFNPTTSKRYKGINALHLMSEGYADQRWMTYKQAASAGAQVRHGEKGTPIQYWKFSEEQGQTDAGGKPVLGSDGHQAKQAVRLERPQMFFSTVFNAAQIDGLASLPPRAPAAWVPAERAETILQASGAAIEHGGRDSAFYRPSTDTIHLPDKGQFATADNYYATALHELGHWTGHATRLDRDLVHPFGSEGYAREELRAEIASMLLGDELGIGHDPGQHAAYVGSWIRVLQSDPLEIFRAASGAEKIQAYVLGLEQVQTLAQAAAPQQQALATTDDARIIVSERVGGKDLFSQSFATLDEAARCYVTKSAGANRSMAAADGRVLASVVWGPDGDFECERFATPEVEAVVAVAQNGYWKTLDAVQENTRADQTAGEVIMLAETKNEGDSEVVQAQLAQFEQGSGQTPAGQAVPGESVILLAVPFREKEEAKALGARWDRAAQSWSVPPGVDPAVFDKWHSKPAADGTGGQAPRDGEEAAPHQPRRYLSVPYGERKLATAAGAAWDKVAKSWYAGAKANMARLARWIPGKVGVQQDPVMTAQEEFAGALRSLRCVVSGEHPMMDGRKHRITVEGEKHSEHSGSGFYVAHMDGHPAGHIKNNKTGEAMDWKHKGYTLDPEQKARLQAEAATKLRQRLAEQEQLQEAAASRIARQMAGLVPMTEPTPYLVSKGLLSTPGVFTDKTGKTSYIPAIDVDGKQWSMQYIGEDGAKRFARDSRKTGCFHAVGGLDALVNAPALVIAEGYATAASLSRSLGFATVAAFDSGNLPLVAKALHGRFPAKPVIIAGDNDQHLEATQGINPGKDKAQEAAHLTGGRVLLPIFAPGELAADPKGYTDFNDLASKSRLGMDGLDRQVRPAVESAIESRHANSNQDALSITREPLQRRLVRSGQQ